MKIVLISLTKNGRIISEKIGACLNKEHICTRYIIQKYADESVISFSDLRELTADIFYEYDALVYICACGIAVRMIAPHIVSKMSDPAVIAVDEQGKFVVSLLSGHLGGANALTEKIAAAIGAAPIITTATDIGGKFSPDSFAKANRLHICEMDVAKEIASATVNDEKIGFYCDFQYLNRLNNVFGFNCRTGICISSDIQKNPFERTLHLVPKNVVIGIGCRKNTSPEVLSEFIMSMLEKYDIPLWKVGGMHTIDVKKNEYAITEFSRRNRIPLKFHTAEELMSVNGHFSHSDFVLKTVGADNVCERCVVIGGGHLIVSKQAEHGMTFAAGESNVTIDFERTIL